MDKRIFDRLLRDGRGLPYSLRDDIDKRLGCLPIYWASFRLPDWAFPDRKVWHNKRNLKSLREFGILSNVTKVGPGPDGSIIWTKVNTVIEMQAARHEEPEALAVDANDLGLVRLEIGRTCCGRVYDSLHESGSIALVPYEIGYTEPQMFLLYTPTPRWDDWVREIVQRKVVNAI